MTNNDNLEKVMTYCYLCKDATLPSSKENDREILAAWTNVGSERSISAKQNRQFTILHIGLTTTYDPHFIASDIPLVR